MMIIWRKSESWTFKERIKRIILEIIRVRAEACIFFAFVVDCVRGIGRTICVNDVNKLTCKHIYE